MIGMPTGLIELKRTFENRPWRADCASRDLAVPSS